LPNRVPNAEVSDTTGVDGFDAAGVKKHFQEETCPGRFLTHCHGKRLLVTAKAWRAKRLRFYEDNASPFRFCRLM